MADTIIDPTAENTLDLRNLRLGPIWINEDVAYVFYVARFNTPAYSKTTDGGVNWSAPTDLSIFTVAKMSVWYDKWTPGDTGTMIHVVWIDNAQHDIKYRNLDTDDDSFGTERTVFNGATFETGTWNTSMVDITKARGGNLHIGFWGDNDGEFGFYRSTDDGVNWTSRAQLADGNAVDKIILMPGSETDNQDIWCFYHDASASEISLKIYDNSADSWSETSIVTSIFNVAQYLGMSAAPRDNDNHVIFGIFDLVFAVLRIWDVGGSGDITEKTNVVTGLTNSGQIAIMINQQTDDIYVLYLKGGALGDSVDVVYKKSTDGGSTWGSEQAYSEAAADDVRAVWAGISVGDAGGKFQPAFFNDDLNDLLVNLNNDVDIAGPAGEVIFIPRVFVY